MSLAASYNSFEAPSQTEPQACTYPPASRGKPPSQQGAGPALSDRPTCRIYPDRSRWILQLQVRGGWMTADWHPKAISSSRR